MIIVLTYRKKKYKGEWSKYIVTFTIHINDSVPLTTTIETRD